MHIAKAAGGQERLNLAAINAKHIFLAGKLCGTPERFGIAIGCIVEDLDVEIIEDQCVARSGMGGYEGQRAVNALPGKEISDALPDKERFSVPIVAAGGQAVSERQRIEIDRQKGEVIGQRVNDLLQAFQFFGLGGGVIDFEYTGLLHAGDAVGTRIKAGPQDDDLVQAIVKAGDEKIIDVALAGDNKPNPTRSHPVIQAGSDDPFADRSLEASGGEGLG